MSFHTKSQTLVIDSSFVLVLWPFKTLVTFEGFLPRLRMMHQFKNLCSAYCCIRKCCLDQFTAIFLIFMHKYCSLLQDIIKLVCNRNKCGLLILTSNDWIVGITWTMSGHAVTFIMVASLNLIWTVNSVYIYFLQALHLNSVFLICCILSCVTFLIFFSYICN
jgi:hypothetical protein